MALTKVTYVNGETVIGAENLNDIQDSVIQLESDTGEMSGDITALQTGAETMSGNITTLQNTTGTQGTAITALQGATTTQGNKITALGTMTAPVEASATAASAHAVGDYFRLNDVLYVATAAIAVGDTITAGTNCRVAVVGDDLSDLKSVLTNNVVRDNEFFGFASASNIPITSSVTRKKLVSFDMVSGKSYTLSVTLSSANNGDSWLYVCDSSGNVLYGSFTLRPSKTTWSMTITANANYSGAYVAYTTSYANTVTSATVTWEGSELHEIQAKLTQEYQLYHCSLVSESGIDTDASYKQGHIFSADSVKIKTTSDAYCCLVFYVYKVYPNDVITCKASRSVGNNRIIRIDCFDSSGNRIGAENWSGRKVVPEGTAYAVINICACWGTALGEDTEVTFTDISIKLSNISELEENVYGSGDSTYTGERIILSNDDDRLRYYDVSCWKDFLLTDIPDLADYKLYLNQSMAICNGYVFLFQQNGTCLVLDYSDASIVGNFSFEPSNTHANSAQFSDIYYESTDDYPLLFVARCGNATDGVTDKDECNVYRVVESNGTFTFTLINSIYANFQTYGNSWALDTVRNRIVMVALINARYTQTSDNPAYAYVWDMPTRTEIISGTPIYLDEDDAVAHMMIEDGFGIQGMTYEQGVLYAGGTFNSATHWIYAIDVDKGHVKSKVSISHNYYEIEGISIYNGVLYYSMKKGIDTIGTNPCQIYSATF